MQHSAQGVASSQPIKKEHIKDPRLKNNPPMSKDPRLIKSEKSTSPTDKSKQFKPYSKSPTQQQKSTSRSAVTVLNKIMTSLNTKKHKPSNGPSQPAARNKPTEEATHSPVPVKTLPDLESKIVVSVPAVTTSNHITTAAKQVSDSKIHTSSFVASTDTKTSVSVPVASVPVPQTNNTPVSMVETSVPSTPFAGAFSQLSSRDMQIAAQAAAIATAMHQMQSNVTSAMAPEQSAQLAAQLIQLVQGTVNNSTVQQTETVPISTTDTKSSIKDTHDASEVERVETNKNNAPAEEVETEGNASKGVTKNGEKTERISRSPPPMEIPRTPPRDLNWRPDNSLKKDEFGRDINRENKSRDRSPYNTRKDTRHSRHHSRERYEQEPRQRVSSTDNNYRGGRERVRGRDRMNNDRDEPPSKKPCDHSMDASERSRKARARSPSRYYNRMERKIESEKRVEENEKELVFQRIRKNSDGELTVLRKKSDSDSVKQDDIDELDDIELPEVNDTSNKIDLPDTTVTHEKKPSNVINTLGNKPEGMAMDEWIQIKKVRRKEFKCLKAKLMEMVHQKEDPKAQIDLSVFTDFKLEVSYLDLFVFTDFKFEVSYLDLSVLQALS